MNKILLNFYNYQEISYSLAFEMRIIVHLYGNRELSL